MRLAVYLAPVFLLPACSSKRSGAPIPVATTTSFTEVHTAAGIRHTHEFRTFRSTSQYVIGGVACGDYDRDGFDDLYVVGGDRDHNLLYRNKGDGSFEELGESAGVRIPGGAWSGATFADINADGFLDLLVCGIDGTRPCVLLNQKNGTFLDATQASNLNRVLTDSFCSAFGDYDRDGDLDLFITQWRVERKVADKTQHLWKNNGSGIFSDESASSGVTLAIGAAKDFTDLTFAPNFADVDNDGFLDLIVSGDLGTNIVLRNADIGGGARGFQTIPNPAIVTDHSSGSALGDYDNDGLLDWFVSGIFSPAGSPTGAMSGNRLFRNTGGGVFQDVTEAAGVRDGGWGWGATFADLNNDGHLDIVQVNGFGLKDTDDFFADPARIFMADGNGGFEEQAAALGFDEVQQGRGVVCFDFDRDGDIDIFVANILGEPKLWRNDITDSGNYLTVVLTFQGGNLQGIGSRVAITVGGKTQIRDIRAGSNYASQNPAEAHFGLGSNAVVDLIEVTWPDGTKTTQSQVAANQLLRVTK